MVEEGRSPVSRLTLVAAVADNGVIGAAGGIPWRIPEDFAHFKRVTLGHTLVMGRATYDSIGCALPGRTTIVLTRDPAWSAPDVTVAGSLGFATPLGYQTHMMVYSPGGYRFTDFLRIGIPMDLICWIIAMITIPMVLPLVPR